MTGKASPAKASAGAERLADALMSRAGRAVRRST